MRQRIVAGDNCIRDPGAKGQRPHVGYHAPELQAPSTALVDCAADRAHRDV